MTYDQHGKVNQKSIRNFDAGRFEPLQRVPASKCRTLHFN